MSGNRKELYSIIVHVSSLSDLSRQSGGLAPDPRVSQEARSVGLESLFNTVQWTVEEGLQTD